MTKRAKKCGNKKLSFTLNEKRERGREREAKGENKSDDENDQMSGLLCAQCQLLSPREKKKTVSKKCNTDKA